MPFLVAAAGLIVSAGFSTPASATGDAALGVDTAVSAKADFIAADGQALGSAVLDESPNGVLIRLELEGLPPGEHAIHIHEQGDCSPVETQDADLDAQNYFANAGGHLNPGDLPHGLMYNEDAPHPGDLPNIYVSPDGALRTHLFTDRVTFKSGGDLADGRAALLDEDGAALIIHEGADDYESQPTGQAGDRIACAVIQAE